MTPTTYTVVHARNPFDPARDRTVSTRTRRVRLSTLAPKTTLPFICLVNGSPVLRAEWDKRPAHGDIVAFVTLPQGGGGGGSNPLQMVAMIALTYFTMGAGAGAWATVGNGMATAAGGLTFAGSMMGGVAFMAGSALINALIPPPRPPTPHQQAAMAAPSPTYSLNAQGNSARLGAAIPVQYGRHVAFPDFAAEPYAEFVGNEQYLYQLLCIGQGSYDIEAIRIEDTPIASFEDITYEVIAPGGTVTLFPTDVVNSIEVAGQEALSGTALGPFIVNGSGTLANHLGVDVVCPKGLYYANDSGGLTEKSVTFTVEAQTVDGSGVGYGSWVTLGTETISAATNTAQRRSYKYAVAEARYQVKLTRTDTKDTSARAGHDLNWAGLRAYLPGDQQYGGLTVLAMRMRASNSLSQAASRRVNVIATRKLPNWNPTTGWSAAVATSSIAWAAADVLRADYGAKLADAYIDLNQLYVLDQIWQARGDTFSGRFDSTMTVWEALTQVLRCGRAKPYQQGGIVHVVRDQAQTVPVAMFSHRNIVRGSLKVDYLMPTEETADAVIVQYFDATTWKPTEVTAQLPGSTAANPVKLQLFGCTDRDQAWREGMYMAACNRYRRKPITHTTEMEGFIPTFGDLVALSHVRLTRAQSGEVTAWDAATRTLTLDEPLSWTAGQNHYIGLRKRDGGFAGPYLATAGADAYQAVLAELPSLTPYVGGNEERTHYSFGTGTEYRELALLTSARPRGMHQVELSYINDDPLVHTADSTTAPDASVSWALSRIPTVPVVTGLALNIAGSASAPMFLLSWEPSPGADYYLVECSTDSGSTWTHAGAPTTASISFTPPRQDAQVRVAAVGRTRSDWVVVGSAGRDTAAPITAAQILIPTISEISSDLGDINAGSIRGVCITAGAHITTGSFLNNSTSGGDTTVNVRNTDDFPSSGSAWIIDSINDRDSISYTGKTDTELTGCTGVLSHNAGATIMPAAKGMVIDAKTNEMRYYGDRGDGQFAELGAIGVTPDGTVASFGSGASSLCGLVAVGGAIGGYAAAYGVHGIATQGIGVVGSSGLYGAGVYGFSTEGPGGRFAGNARKGNLELVTLAGRPTNRDATQIVAIYTTGGTTDARTATSRLFYSDGTDWRYIHDNAIFTG